MKIKWQRILQPIFMLIVRVQHVTRPGGREPPPVHLHFQAVRGRQVGKVGPNIEHKYKAARIPRLRQDRLTKRM